MRLKQTFLFLLISALIHGTVLMISAELPSFNWNQTAKSEPTSLKINSIRTVGEKTGKKNLFFVKKKEVVKKNKKASKEKIKNLSFKDLKMNRSFRPGTAKSILAKKSKSLKGIRLSKKTAEDFIKSTPPGFMSPSQVLSALDNNDVDIKLEVPEGVKEDELNKIEQVFYSFQRRTAMAYINSFYNELNTFERKNPHLRFPLTAKKQKMSGRITYDKNGDILKIETLRWTDIQKLQTFFMEVLKNMSSLPNPPEQIMQDEKFVINFALTINS